MHSKYFPVRLIFFITFLLDLYVFSAIKKLTKRLSSKVRTIIHYSYWSITFINIAFVCSTFIIDFYDQPRFSRTYLFAFLIITVLSKIIAAIILLIDDIRRASIWTFFMAKNIYSTQKHKAKDTKHSISRSTFLSQLSLITAGIPFSSLMYGIFQNAYNYQVHHIDITLPKLPKVFNGLKIVQISDIHTGSFVFKEPIQKGIDIINKLGADIIFFTGDLVNTKTDEVNGFIDLFKQIKSKNGVISILGNHDYGDYKDWSSPKAKAKNLDDMIESHKKLGWQLLRNEHTIFEKDGKKIGIIGVENWSAHKNFTKYGDLKKSVEQMPKDIDLKILLSHDPSHWDAEVSQTYQDIDLTLAGHTHGMQFGVEIPGWKWSPVKYLYKQWAGLYKKGAQYLYVNRGFGFIGYPGRVGILPEITLITLKST